MTDVAYNPTNATTEDLIQWLELRYEKRLALYPNILTDPIFRHTEAAQRLRILKAAASLLKDEALYLSLKEEVINALTIEKNTLFELFGFKRLSYEMFEKVILEINKNTNHVKVQSQI